MKYPTEGDYKLTSTLFSNSLSCTCDMLTECGLRSLNWPWMLEGISIGLCWTIGASTLIERLTCWPKCTRETNIEQGSHAGLKFKADLEIALNLKKNSEIFELHLKMRREPWRVCVQLKSQSNVRWKWIKSWRKPHLVTDCHVHMFWVAEMFSVGRRTF